MLLALAKLGQVGSEWSTISDIDSLWPHEIVEVITDINKCDQVKDTDTKIVSLNQTVLSRVTFRSEGYPEDIYYDRVSVWVVDKLVPLLDISFIDSMCHFNFGDFVLNGKLHRDIERYLKNGPIPASVNY